MTRVRILPYRQGSRGAAALAAALPRCRVLKLNGSRFRPRPVDVIINWGNTDPQRVHWQGAHPRTILNLPNQVRDASNKLFFFNNMRERGVNLVPHFWTNREDIPDEAFPVVCRTVLAGHSGAGIHIANTRDDLVDAPLYVKYIKKQDEYRVHVGRRNDQSIIISVQRKARREGFENPNWQVRNHNNGFVFVRGGVNPPQSVLDAASRSLEAIGLDFGAVDVIWNARQEAAYVLEINTAPGLEGQTVQDYADFFNGFIER